LTDNFGRTIDSLRVSVTDRCNLRCLYCMPEDGLKLKNKEEILSIEEIIQITKIFTNLGIKKVRLTGGEPLLRNDLIEIIKKLIEINPIEDLSITTNGTILSDFCLPLKNAGIKRINISLDTLNKKKFGLITRVGKLSKIKKSINRAIETDFSPIKINVVVIKGFNEDEISDFAKLTFEYPLQIRFIEFMPSRNGNFWNLKRFIPESEIRKRCEALGKLFPIEISEGSRSAKVFKYENSIGNIGFISPISDRFCDKCGKVRITADGLLKLCLFSEKGLNLKDSIRKGIKDTEIEESILSVIKLKPESHSIDLTSDKNYNLLMSQIGG
ncbi:GTP 3',8-cyclase MoaA, partial [candidate division KSB1 bacterium]